jgi:hypothetical protein
MKIINVRVKWVVFIVVLLFSVAKVIEIWTPELVFYATKMANGNQIKTKGPSLILSDRFNIGSEQKENISVLNRLKPGNEKSIILAEYENTETIFTNMKQSGTYTILAPQQASCQILVGLNIGDFEGKYQYAYLLEEFKVILYGWTDVKFSAHDHAEFCQVIKEEV